MAELTLESYRKMFAEARDLLSENRKEQQIDDGDRGDNRAALLDPGSDPRWRRFSRAFHSSAHAQQDQAHQSEGDQQRGREQPVGAAGQPHRHAVLPAHQLVGARGALVQCGGEGGELALPGEGIGLAERIDEVITGLGYARRRRFDPAVVRSFDDADRAFIAEHTTLLRGLYRSHPAATTDWVAIPAWSVPRR